MGTIIVPTKTNTTKTTCIEISAETFKCIDISAYVPTCIMITSNIPTSEHYEKPREDLKITEAPELQIALINNEAPVLNVNMDENGVYYVTDFDTVYIDITNWNTNAEYVNLFSNDDGNDAVVFLDEANQRIIWSLDDYALDGTKMWFYAQAKESDKLISPQSNVTVMQMEQTDQPNLSSWVSQTEQTILNITILDYNATYTYSEPIVTGGTAVRTDNIIAWTLPDVTADTYHEISITATAPLMYESLSAVSGGVVLNSCIPIFTGLYDSIYLNISVIGWEGLSTGYEQNSILGQDIWLQYRISGNIVKYIRLQGPVYYDEVNDLVNVQVYSYTTTCNKVAIINSNQDVLVAKGAKVYLIVYSDGSYTIS